jgi:hypothetical protein
VACPAFALGVAAGPIEGLSAPLGVGAIGLIATAQAGVQCYTNLMHLVGQLRPPLEQASRDKQLADVMNREKAGGEATNFDRQGDRITIRDRDGTERDVVRTGDTGGDSFPANERDSSPRWDCDFGARVNNRGHVETFMRCRSANGGKDRSVEHIVDTEEGGEGLLRPLFD